MQRHRFFAPPEQINNSLITLDSDESHHLSRVLRLSSGATVFAFDGLGNEYQCEVAEVSKKSVSLSIIAPVTDPVESPLDLTLGQAILQNDKFDLIVQKATELGVTRIVPLITEFCEFRKVTGNEQRLQRWKKIALEATKQCGRRIIPDIAEPLTFTDFCQKNQSLLRLIFSEQGGGKLLSLPEANSISVVIGPKGGWSQAELSIAKENNFTAIYLSNRILKAETAAIAATALLQLQFGDLSL
jgi:16S rRNA (uracil1498-N3)-methyltransferase